MARAAVSFRMIGGWVAMVAPGLSSTMSSPWALEKNRPPTGLSPCSSKKPTSTWASLRVCIDRSGLKMTVLLFQTPIAGPEPQDTARTPRRFWTS